MATLSVPPPEREQTTPRLTAYGSVFFWGAVWLLIVGLLSYVIIGFGVDHFTDAEAARVLERQKILQDISATDYKYLHDKPGWFKKDAGLVRVPIDEAMAMTLPALRAAKPHPAYPIAQSPPQNSAAPTSPDKGAGQAVKTPGKTNDNNPSAANPTLTPPTPTPSPTAAPTVANSPGPAPIPGTQPQPSAPPAATNTSGAVPAAATPTATVGATAAPLTNPPAQPTPASAASTPTPNPQEPGASPAGTP